MRNFCAAPKFGSCQGSLLELCGAFRSVGLLVSFQAAPSCGTHGGISASSGGWHRNNKMSKPFAPNLFLT